MAQDAFQKLKHAMVSCPVLAMPDFTRLFVIKCNVSGRGIGVILMLDKRPIAYFSKALSDGALSKSAYEKEMMALVLAIQHWRPYLIGKRFQVHTDQRSLRHLLQQQVTTPAQQHWALNSLGIILKLFTSLEFPIELLMHFLNEKETWIVMPSLDCSG